MNTFIGIPYAKPPIDSLRFTAPQEPDTWHSTQPYPANGDLKPACIQPHSPVFLQRPDSVSEDCLYLNVYTPAGDIDINSNYAVMIWFHGGRFITEEGGEIYNPQTLMETVTNIIVITFNSRLGLLGYLYDNHYDTGIDGNFGYLDQKLLIEFVYDNIQQFGGNPDKITLFGEASGALSVALHLLYNDALIYGAIMQSIPVGVGLRTVDTWNDVAVQFTNLVGCNMTIHNVTELVDCWRSVSAGDILKAQNNSLLVNNFYEVLKFTPTIGTTEIAQQVIDGFLSKGSTKPFIMGLNADEAFHNLNSESSTLWNYNTLRTVLGLRYGENNIDHIFRFYNVSSDGTGFEYKWARIITDQVWRCPIWNIVNAVDNDVYSYQFEEIDGVYTQLMPEKIYCDEFVCHSAELIYFWRPLTNEYDYSEESMIITTSLYNYWTNFAKTLNVNGNGTDWEMFNENGEVWRTRYSLNESVVFDQSQVCDFWDIVGYAGDYCDTADCWDDYWPLMENMTTTTTLDGTTEEGDDAEQSSLLISIMLVFVSSLITNV